jgi:hypothetical protein
VPTEYPERTKADRFAPDPDPDPLLTCSREDCDSKVHWREVKDSDDWQASPDPSEELLCPSCLKTRRRRRENQQLPQKVRIDDGS